MGRGVSPPMRGRGVSPAGKDPPNVPTTGRAYNRGSMTGKPGSSTSDQSSTLSSSLSALKVSTITSSGQGSVTGDGSMGRGAVRGRRDRATDFYVRTRPDALQSKRGTLGDEMACASNYFALIAKPNWRLLQYRVDMSPEIDNTRVRKALLYNHKSSLPKFMFDGTIMFTTSRLNPDDAPIILTSTRESDKATIRITIKLLGEVQPTDYHYMQFFNIVLRSAMEKMQLELIRRNYFDPKAAITLGQYKLELWPGYVTSIRQHESQILLCCEVSHKILRTDTVLQQIGEVHQKTRGGPSFHADVEKALLGAIIITRYNNKTYRIDEIAWDKKPTDEFEGKDGEMLSYMKYYETRYNRKINDLKQPLLISMPKVREQRSGVSGPIYLIPELCNMTGLSDQQRANFSLMKAMGEYTRQDPEKRTKTLLKFSERLHGTKEISEELKGWNLQFAQDLLKFRARIFKPETILGSKGSKASYHLENADWNRAFRKWNCFAAPSCSKR